MAGFTLIELVITIMLLAVIGGLGGSVVQVVYDSFSTANIRQELDSRGRYAMERMARELRGASRASISSGSGNSITFTDQSGTSVTFSKSDTNNLMRGSSVLTANVTTLNFTRTVGATVSVKIDMTVTSGSQSTDLQVTVYPRNS
ncbi:MAG: prepilin-type N-terminal cleavage/methylation domain-containing protein [Magnetococcales bacterium]|nr:prepilin-type N-terminal cleavage/methylation domain-containing protein [Magnetococcales bacterium]NGZ27371.1 prepilin-type N-terminal cleavage/methylation domain-containing protein [Magnetococcales bacterium]